MMLLVVPKQKRKWEFYININDTCFCKNNEMISSHEILLDLKKTWKIVI